MENFLKGKRDDELIVYIDELNTMGNMTNSIWQHLAALLDMVGYDKKQGVINMIDMVVKIGNCDDKDERRELVELFIAEKYLVPHIGSYWDCGDPECESSHDVDALEQDLKHGICQIYDNKAIDEVDGLYDFFNDYFNYQMKGLLRGFQYANSADEINEWTAMVNNGEVKDFTAPKFREYLKQQGLEDPEQFLKENAFELQMRNIAKMMGM